MLTLPIQGQSELSDTVSWLFVLFCEQFIYSYIFVWVITLVFVSHTLKAVFLVVDASHYSLWKSALKIMAIPLKVK